MKVECSRQNVPCLGGSLHAALNNVLAGSPCDKRGSKRDDVYKQVIVAIEDVDYHEQ